jgi:hypothetical protein
VPVKTFGQGNKLMLEMLLTEDARALIASAANRLSALLETRVTDANGPVCRNVFSSVLLAPGSR